jgi:hypothetical protein
LIKKDVLKDSKISKDTVVNITKVVEKSLGIKIKNPEWEAIKDFGIKD